MNSLELSIERLNPDQRTAVEQSSSTVVLAGPGSGKTDTIVVKVASLLIADIPPPRGVACITFGNDAVHEYSTRLRSFGLRPSHRLFLGTVHSFCLNRVLRPFAALVGRPDLARPQVLTVSGSRQLLDESLHASGIHESAARFEHTLNRIRRAAVCGDSLEVFHGQHVAVADHYDAQLARRGMVDFESMTLHALRIVRDSPEVRQLLVARFPWIAVDEYQDLGGPLHAIVTELRAAGANLFAVGDPDQCILTFSGADPSHLVSLATDDSLSTVRLRLNYRSGARLVAAAAATLGEERHYEAAGNREHEGEVFLDEVSNGLEGQAELIVGQLVPALIASGIEPHEIAILYKQKGELLDALLDEIGGADERYLVERDIRFPSSPFVRWLQRCAASAAGSGDTDPFADLVGVYAEILDRGGAHADDLVARATLFEALSPTDPEADLSGWLRTFDERLTLAELLEADGATPEDVAFLFNAREASAAVSVHDFARGAQVRGQVVLTTCHAAKGREFDVVIIPGLQVSLFPFARWSDGAYRSSPADLEADRSLFYVSLTRARQEVHLVYSPWFVNRWGRRVHGPSQYVHELADHLGVELV